MEFAEPTSVPRWIASCRLRSIAFSLANRRHREPHRVHGMFPDLVNRGRSWCHPRFPHGYVSRNPSRDLFPELPRTAYFIFVARKTGLGRNEEGYPLRLQDPLSAIGLPLGPGRPDLPLDLAAAFQSADRWSPASATPRTHRGSSDGAIRTRQTERTARRIAPARLGRRPNGRASDSASNTGAIGSTSRWRSRTGRSEVGIAGHAIWRIWTGTCFETAFRNRLGILETAAIAIESSRARGRCGQVFGDAPRLGDARQNPCDLRHPTLCSTSVFGQRRPLAPPILGHEHFRQRIDQIAMLPKNQSSLTLHFNIVRRTSERQGVSPTPLTL
jgi:hypothetical protein